MSTVDGKSQAPHQKKKKKKKEKKKGGGGRGGYTETTRFACTARARQSVSRGVEQ